MTVVNSTCLESTPGIIDNLLTALELISFPYTNKNGTLIVLQGLIIISS